MHKRINANGAFRHGEILILPHILCWWVESVRGPRVYCKINIPLKEEGKCIYKRNRNDGMRFRNEGTTTAPRKGCQETELGFKKKKKKKRGESKLRCCLFRVQTSVRIPEKQFHSRMYVQHYESLQRSPVPTRSWPELQWTDTMQGTVSQPFYVRDNSTNNSIEVQTELFESELLIKMNLR